MTLADVPDVTVVSSAHWQGDPRLNRHVAYLQAAGIEAEFVTTKSSSGRVASAVNAVVTVMRLRSPVVILPNPELFLFGTLAARLTGKRPVIDIHEDYPKVAAARQWIPDLARPLVGWLAGLFTWLGRILAWRIVVAAPELASPGDYLVLNVPDPGSFSPSASAGSSRRLVYVGDVTVARGVLEMVDTLGELDAEFELVVIGAVDDETRRLVTSKASKLGVTDRLNLAGRLPHAEAWALARESVAGLNPLRPVPAYREAVATKLWEYMAAGLPPLVSDLPGQSAVVSEIDPALVCATAKEFAEQAIRLSRDTGFREEVVTTGLEMVNRKWSEHRPDLTIQEAVTP